MSGPVDIRAGAEGAGGVNSAVSLGFADVGAPVGIEFFLPWWVGSFEGRKRFFGSLSVATNERGVSFFWLRLTCVAQT
jgi:hypothetical protein